MQTTVMQLQMELKTTNRNTCDSNNITNKNNSTTNFAWLIAWRTTDWSHFLLSGSNKSPHTHTHTQQVWTQSNAKRTYIHVFVLILENILNWIILDMECNPIYWLPVGPFTVHFPFHAFRMLTQSRTATNKYMHTGTKCKNQELNSLCSLRLLI